jgi:hypothetical protein
MLVILTDSRYRSYFFLIRNFTDSIDIGHISFFTFFFDKKVSNPDGYRDMAQRSPALS